MFDLTYKAEVKDDKLKESLKEDLNRVSITRYPIQTLLETGEHGKVSHSWMYILNNGVGSFVPIYNDKEVTLEVRVSHTIDIPPEFKEIIERYGFEETYRKDL